MESKLLELSDFLKELKDEKASIEQNLKKLNEEIESLTKEMIDMMTSEELSSFNRNGTTFSLVVQEYQSPESELKDKLWEVMKKQGFEHLFTINSQTLQATLKELKANNEDTMPSWLDGLVKTAEKSSIRITKSKKY